MKPVPGHKGYYATRDGRIFGPYRELKGYLETTGYLKTMIKRKKKSIHRLVLSAFEPCPDPSLEVNHKDGNKLNNAITNLEWVTRTENLRHARQVLGVGWRDVPVQGIDPETGEVLYEFPSLSASTPFGFDFCHIHKCITGQRRTHKGLSWRRI
jgi:hypothetical protein